IVIGAELAKHDAVKLLDYFQRYRQSQMRSYVLFSKKEAADILRYKPKFERLAAEILREENKVGMSASVRLNEFIHMYLEDGQEAYAPLVDIVPSEVKTAVKEKYNNLAMLGLGVMRGKSFAGWLRSNEMRGLMWLKNEMKSGV